VVDPDPVRQDATRTGIIAPPTIAMIMIPDPSPVSGPSSAMPRVKNWGT